jgi:hypothetical protein
MKEISYLEILIMSFVDYFMVYIAAENILTLYLYIYANGIYRLKFSVKVKNSHLQLRLPQITLPLILPCTLRPLRDGEITISLKMHAVTLKSSGKTA